MSEQLASLHKKGGGGIEAKLLWTNSAPTSSYAAQTLAIDLSEYDGIILKCIGIYSAAQTFPNIRNTQQFIPKSFSGTLLFGTFESSGNIYISYRTVNVTNNGIVFGSGYQRTGASIASNDTRAIPYEVWGVKGTTFTE